MTNYRQRQSTNAIKNNHWSVILICDTSTKQLSLLTQIEVSPSPRWQWAGGVCAGNIPARRQQAPPILFPLNNKCQTLKPDCKTALSMSRCIQFLGLGVNGHWVNVFITVSGESMQDWGIVIYNCDSPPCSELHLSMQECFCSELQNCHLNVECNTMWFRLKVRIWLLGSHQLASYFYHTLISILKFHSTELFSSTRDESCMLILGMSQQLTSISKIAGWFNLREESHKELMS